ncbi:MAG: phosphoribosylglycinamide formyltransferase [Deltaproteobacteria bacterium]|jgi:phosphoribosylglycinamide formyltransferase-1|nr:phosphoribosylglycinamide formyltransferase [Deltaproteobacteria bacterium]
MNIAVLCSGRGSNFLNLLMDHEKGLITDAEFVVMLTDNKAAGALNVAREFEVPTLVVPRSAYHANREGFERRLLEVLEPYRADLIVLAGFERVLGETFLNAYPQKVINIHPALLPSFPGHRVWQDQLDHGVKLAGATVHFVDVGVDSGPIIIQGVVPVLDADDADTLADRILQVEHWLLPKAVALITAGRVTVSGRKVAIKDIPRKIIEDAAFHTMVWPPLDV